MILYFEREITYTIDLNFIIDVFYDSKPQKVQLQ